jgi:hypothetical protein
VLRFFITGIFYAPLRGAGLVGVWADSFYIAGPL